MRVDRRAFLGGVIPGALAAGAVRAQPGAGPAGTGAPQAYDAKPFFGDKGARSPRPAPETQALAAHSINVRFSDLDPLTVHKAKQRILDVIGCAIGGAPAAGNAALVDFVRSEAGPAEASVIGYPLRASAAQVAMVNAVIARSYDYEVMTVVADGKYVGSHHSPTTFMTTLAMCERNHSSGSEFITTLVIADDIAARTLAASGSDLGLGWDGASMYTAIPAAAIASRALGLTPQQTQDAFGLTVDTIAGTHQCDWDGTTDWKLHQGLAAHNGIFAAKLAQRGWVGIGDALRAPFGFYGLYTDGCAHPEILTAKLGKAFYAEEYFKPYPACMAAHTSLECALALRTANSLAPADIQRVVLRAPGGLLVSALGKQFDFESRYPHCEANFSLQFQVANALLNGSLRQEHYADSAIRAPALTSLIHRVSLEQLPADRADIEIEVTTHDGHKLLQRHSGTPDRFIGVKPFTQDEIIAKFRRQVEFSGFVPTRTAEEIIRRVDALEHETDMADFVKLLTRTHLPQHSGADRA